MFTQITERATGRTYYYKKSGFCGECWHIYVAENYDAHIYNLFSKEEFDSQFESFNREKCARYIESIRNR